MKISVFGLGYVGCVSAACFAELGHEVTGVDISPEKIKIINSGRSPIIEPGLNQLISEAKNGGKLSATMDYKTAIKNSDISLVCVGTPSKKNGSVSLEYIFRVAEQVGESLKNTKNYHVFVIRSTVPPDTLEKSLEIIAKHSEKKIGEDFG